MKDFKTFFAIFCFIALAIGSAGNDGTEAYDEQLEKTKSTNESSAPAEPVDYESKVELETTALEMSRVYQENELKGDATFKGKWVKVSGTVKDIGKEDAFDDNFNEYTYLKLSLKGASTSGNKVVESEYSTVNFSFNLDQMNDLINLKPDSKVTVIGYMKGVDLMEEPDIKGYKILE